VYVMLDILNVNYTGVRLNFVTMFILIRLLNMHTYKLFMRTHFNVLLISFFFFLFYLDLPIYNLLILISIK
jgi:hypothetical protein